MSVIDDFLQRISAAVTDTRRRVVEEPKFGRIVTYVPDLTPSASPDQR